jgi:hypothetical protein
MPYAEQKDDPSVEFLTGEVRPTTLKAARAAGYRPRKPEHDDPDAPPPICIDTPGTAVTPQPDPAEVCLTRLLRTFFPSNFGASARHQARGYIRTSAIGRGSYPQGSPGPKGLISALESLGFSQRVHRGHLQAPWGSRGRSRSLRLRNELSAFLRDGRKGPNVRALLTRIRNEGRWATQVDETLTP